MPLGFADHQAIQELLIRYAFAVDAKADENVFLDLFTENALLDGPGGAHRGTEGVRQFAQRFNSNAGYRNRHLITNFLIEGDGDHASIAAYFMRVKTIDGVEAPEVSVGTYDCTAQRIGGTWKLEQRIVDKGK